MHPPVKLVRAGETNSDVELIFLANCRIPDANCGRHAGDARGRRILMTTYNPAQSEDGVLYPCHGLIVQFHVENKKRINLQMYQRSADSFLGLPFNIASYAALLHIVTNLVNNHKDRAHQIDYEPGRVIMVLGDVHIYSDEKLQSHQQNQAGRGIPAPNVNQAGHTIDVIWLETDALNADSDGDGLPDGWERRNNLDPLDDGVAGHNSQ